MGQTITGHSDNQNPAQTAGVTGTSEIYNGVLGITTAEGHGAVVGISNNHTQKAGPGVYGKSDGSGVWGDSKTWHGVTGISESTTGGAGVYGKSKGSGILGESDTWHAVAGLSKSTTGGAGIYGKGQPLAGLFEGDVAITGTLTAKGIDITSLLQRIQNLERRVDAMSRSTSPRGTVIEICAGNIPEGWVKIADISKPDCSTGIGQEGRGYRIQKL